MNKIIMSIQVIPWITVILGITFILSKITELVPYFLLFFHTGCTALQLDLIEPVINHPLERFQLLLREVRKSAH